MSLINIEPGDFPQIVKPESQGNIQHQFEEFHRLNPWVYQHLVNLARELHRRGHEKLGIGMLFEVLRWQSMMVTRDPNSEFKLNNNYRSRYARLMMSQEPDLRNLFEVRELKS